MTSNALGDQACLVSINISKGGIPKIPVAGVFIKYTGLEGDGHNHEKHNRLEQAVCLQDAERLEELQTEGYAVGCGTTGENLTLRNLNVNALPVETILEFSGGVILELTKVRHPCYVLDSIDPRLKEVIVGRCGFYAQVLREGILKAGESIKLVCPAFHFYI